MKFLPALLAGLLLTSQAPAADFSQPIVSDSRVKTYVYNENEVYPVLTRYGYQTNIEFSRGEEIQTISIGDRVGWQIIPAGRRLFIQTLMEGAETNMTVITNRHSYQFDLQSARLSQSNKDDLVYVARFYYPEEGWDDPAPVTASDSLLEVPAEEAYNYSYTYAGPDAIAPVKIFDDGQATYFQFPAGASPSILAVTAGGKEVPVSAKPQNGYLVVDSIAPQFAVRRGQEVVCVFNEQLRGR